MGRKHANIHDRLYNAEVVLDRLGIPVATLELEWKAQLDSQLAGSPSIYPGLF